VLFLRTWIGISTDSNFVSENVFFVDWVTFVIPLDKGKRTR